jgi:hypothetical protein
VDAGKEEVLEEAMDAILRLFWIDWFKISTAYVGKLTVHSSKVSPISFLKSGNF